MLKQMVGIALAALAVAGVNDGFAKGDSPFLKAFREPANDFSPGYFWMWNAKLEPATIRAQLDEMAANGIRSVCIHPVPVSFRPGKFLSDMSPDYLSEGYFEAYRIAVEHAAKLGMHCWLYDEGGWPSGGACGQVAASDREGRFRQRFIGRGPDDNLPFGVHVREYGPSRASYPSIVEKGAAERFIELTHGRYAKALGDQLGKGVRYAFMDEPDYPQDGWGHQAGWAADFAEQFKARKGYDIMPDIEELLAKKNDRLDERLTRLRIDYYEVMGDLFVERFMVPLRDWCHAHGLLSSGHLNGEDDPEGSNNYGHGPLLKSLRTMDVPGVDVIWRQLFPTTLANPGRQVAFPRYAASAAHQNGTMKVLSESCGIYGDSMTPNEMKWLMDYQMVRGVNMFVYGYYAMSYAGQWMLLFEPHSGPVVPYWRHQRPYFDYITRVSAMLAAGRPVTDIAVLYDERGFRAGGVEAQIAGDRHHSVSRVLDRMNCEFEFIDEEQIDSATVEEGRLKVGAMRYSTVVLPTAKWMRDAAKSKLEEFRSAGGQVLGPDELGRVRPTLRIEGPHAKEIRVAKRRCGDETLYFLVNEGQWHRDVTLTFDEPGPVVQCDAETGRVFTTAAADGKLDWSFDGYGSALFLVGGVTEAEQPFPTAGAYTNVLATGWTLRKSVSHEAGKTALERSSCADAAVPVRLGDWRPVLGDHFSGTAVYRTTFDAETSGRALLDLGRVCWTCSVTLNGQPVGTRFFGPYRFAVDVKKGENVLEVTVANLLANALSDDRVRDRIGRDFPPLSGYDIRQRPFDRDNNVSGLFGPVTIVGPVSTSHLE